MIIIPFFSLLQFFRGSGEDGQLGIGTNEDKDSVCLVKALPSQRVRSVVAGSRNSLAICDDGKVPSSCLVYNNTKPSI